MHSQLDAHEQSSSLFWPGPGQTGTALATSVNAESHKSCRREIRVSQAWNLLALAALKLQYKLSVYHSGVSTDCIAAVIRTLIRRNCRGRC